MILYKNLQSLVTLLLVPFLFLLSACTEDQGNTPPAATDSQPTTQVTLEKVWETDGLRNPESVVYDDRRDRLYVSNVDGAPLEKDGVGSIATVSLSGDIIEQAWIVGLNAPKGLAIYGDALYVADIDRLVEIDISTRTISNTYLAQGALFLNDVAATADGAIFVSDMVSNRIYHLDNDRLTVWLESPELESPNGLYAQDTSLIVGAWGAISSGFATEIPGHMKEINYLNKKIKSMGQGVPIGNLDGIEKDNKGNYYVTDWVAGKLFLISPSGATTLLLQLEQGMADHELIADKRLILLPMMNSNKLLAYKITD